MKRQIVALLSVYALCILLVSLLWPRPTMLSACLVLISLSLLYRWHTRRDLLFYSVAFVLGPLGEAIAVRSGAWTYANPFSLIPLWLPLLWGVVALFLKNLCESLVATRAGALSDASANGS